MSERVPGKPEAPGFRIGDRVRLRSDLPEEVLFALAPRIVPGQVYVIYETRRGNSEDPEDWSSVTVAVENAPKEDWRALSPQHLTRLD